MLPFQVLQDFPLLASIPPAVFIGLLVVLAAWTLVIKAFALWHAARNGQRIWFVALLVLNTLGILELVYLLAFRKDKQSHAVASTSQAA